MQHYYFDVDKQRLAGISQYKLEEHEIEFKTDKTHKFDIILQEGFSNLTNTITKKPATYVHRNSGIPLIGNNSFGIVDRNTNIIELKPITGCNLDCIFCSVPDCFRERDFIVEEEYIVQEVVHIAQYKQCNDLEAHIGVQGEPLLYSDLIKLVKDLSKIPQIKRITMNTNATLLTEELADQLIAAGMTRINISLNSLDPNFARNIADATYNLQHVKNITEYLAKKHPHNVHIAPVVMFGVNDKDMDDLVEYAKKLRINCWIQNFLEYKGGKKPAKQKDWDYFRDFLKKKEKKHNMKLLADFKTDFTLIETKPLPKQFAKNQTVKAEIVCRGRMKNEYIAKYKDRTISYTSLKELPIGKQINLKIVSLKHNIAKAK